MLLRQHSTPHYGVRASLLDTCTPPVAHGDGYHGGAERSGAGRSGVESSRAKRRLPHRPHLPHHMGTTSAWRRARVLKIAECFGLHISFTLQ